ncbi:MAG: hypothetical protein HYX68_03050 [Planctomycetes bacterium]|nr:hypothetical protein [Planctomycetota bacterium]
MRSPQENYGNQRLSKELRRYYDYSLALSQEPTFGSDANGTVKLGPLYIVPGDESFLKRPVASRN